MLFIQSPISPKQCAKLPINIRKLKHIFEF
jgi:hypothetical protein